MSVINKMLRDLDNRQATGTMAPTTPQTRNGIARDTLIVNDSDGTGARLSPLRTMVLMAACAVLLGAAAGAWWYLNQNSASQRVAPAKPKVAAAPALAPAPAPVPASAALVTLPVLIESPGRLIPAPTARVPMKAVTAEVALKIDETLSHLPGPAKTARPVAAQTPPRAAERSQTRPATSSTASSPASAPPEPPVAPRPSAALEVLTQARSLWNSGSHQAAIDLASEALPVAERANLAGTSSESNAVLASLARELARMLLAEGRVSQALEMLTRLEPALSGAADVWAIRGNAAQRLGRHAESAAAYQRALTLRPNEQRWMLGAAVSLAAQGQTVAAGELAEKARAAGVLSPEVASYLRQSGVILPAR